MKADRPTTPLMTGFDFLRTLAGQAGKGMEGLNQLNTLGQGLNAGLGGFKQWVAPTLDPDELDKRIEELRTVQFWLEQNARLLGATIQALEVQKMTLSTLRTMNVKMPDLQQVLGAMVTPVGAQAESASDAPSRAGSSADKEAASAEARTQAGASARKGRSGTASNKGTSKAGAGAAGIVDPMKWWGALTDQFQQLASQALAAAPASSGAAGSGAGAGGARPSSETTSAGADQSNRSQPSSARGGKTGRGRAAATASGPAKARARTPRKT